MFEGKILKEGSAEELAADDTVRRVYLGQNFTSGHAPRAELRIQQPGHILAHHVKFKFMGAPTEVLCKLVCSQV